MRIATVFIHLLQSARRSSDRCYLHGAHRPGSTGLAGGSQKDWDYHEEKISSTLIRPHKYAAGSH